MTPEKIAQVCYAVNRAYCEALGDFSHPVWVDASEWQKDSVMQGVRLHLIADVGPKASHGSWMDEKFEAGWTYGEVKNPKKKTHPCLVPFDDLPQEQQAKDYIFRAVVLALADSRAQTG